MCFDPISILSIVSMGAGVAMSMAQSNAQISAQNARYQAEVQQWQQNYTQSLASARIQQEQITARELQEGDSSQQQRRVQLLEGAKATGTAMAASGFYGVSGISTDNLVADIGRQVNDNLATLSTNWRSTVTQLQKQNDAINLETQASILRVPTPVPPDPTGARLEGLGGALKAITSNIAGLGLKMA